MANKSKYSLGNSIVNTYGGEVFVNKALLAVSLYYATLEKDKFTVITKVLNHIHVFIGPQQLMLCN